MTRKSKKTSAVQEAMTAGLHLDPGETLALIMRGFFSNQNKKPTAKAAHTPITKKHGRSRK